VAVAAILLAAWLWFSAIPRMDIHALTDLGLIGLMPPEMFIALGLVAFAFVLTLYQPRGPGLVTLVIVALVVVMLHGLNSFVEDAPRFATAYLHAGFTDAIATGGRLLPRVDARFNWPLFFSLGAMVTQIANVGSAIEIQRWAALGANLLYLPPLYFIFSALTSDRRLVWTSLLIFYAANWIGQDYYAPQTLNYVLFLTVLAVTLRWFRRTRDPGWLTRFLAFVDRRLPRLRAPMSANPPAPMPVSPNMPSVHRVALVCLMVVMIVVSVASHQLTPFAILLALGVLMVLGRTQLPGMPVLVGVLIGAWISYMTVAFLAGHLVGLLEDLGAPGAAASAGFARRLTGSPGHLFVVQFRLGLTVAFWLLALIGAWRRFRNGYVDLEAVALAVAPFGLLGLQVYGGEMLLRIYLFSLPFMAFLAGAAFVPTVRPLRPPTLRALSVVAVALMIALVGAKYGNERADAITADELAAVNRLYAAAPPESMLVVVNTWGAIRYRDFTGYRYREVTEAFLSEDVPQLAQELTTDAPCTYFIITRSQAAAAQIFWGYTQAEWNAAKSVVVSSPRFHMIYRSSDADILVPSQAPPQCRAGFNVQG
jgi:hypothetical protein